MLLKPEDPGTRLVHPNSIPERPPFHPSMSRPRHSLPSEHVLPQQRSKRVCLRTQIRFVSSSFMSGLWLRQDQPISNPNEEEEEENEKRLPHESKVMWKPFVCLKADIESRFPKNNLATKNDNWFALKPIRVWGRFICSMPIFKAERQRRRRRQIATRLT